MFIRWIECVIQFFYDGICQANCGMRYCLLVFNIGEEGLFYFCLTFSVAQGEGSSTTTQPPGGEHCVRLGS